MSVRSRKFFCCLPVRLGVFALSLLSMIGGSFVAAIGWIQISQLDKHPMENIDKIALWIHSVIFSILALLSVFGFVGALIRSRRMVSSFAVAMAINLGFSVASGIITIYSLFRQNSADAIATCLQESTDPNVTEDTCRQGVEILKGVMIAVYIITWLIQLYAYFVIERYVVQLDDERMAKRAALVPETLQAFAAQPTTYGSFSSPYPFTASGQAYGVTLPQDPSRVA